MGKLIMNGVIYGGGDSEGSENALILDAQMYSLEEQQIGIWTDGKPLYTKTFVRTLANSPDTTSQDSFIIGEGITYVDTLVKIEGTIKDSSNYAFAPTSGLPQTGIGWNYTFHLNPSGQLVAWTTNNSSYYNYIKGGKAVATIYYTKTTDVAGSGGYQAYGFSPIIYSEEEREVGVWIDNKPLYARTYDIPTMIIDPTGTAIPSIDISAVDTFVNGYGVSQEYGQVSPLALYNVNGLNSASSIRISIDKIVMYYTKTTDIPGSGTYTTMGTPTVHYSTNEQVIGTWIDGKPLYQKLFNMNQRVITDNAWSNNILGTSNSDIEIKNYEGYFGLSATNPHFANFNYFRSTTEYFTVMVAINNGHNNDISVRPNMNAGTDITLDYVIIEYTKTTD